ncbi:MFS general substrate transporter [Mycena floridula]|nr:MFS general substrate transporter [Mycena floridula]
MATEQTPLIPKGPEKEMSRRDFALLMTGLWILTFAASLDATIVATLLSTIGSSFESMKTSSWMGTAYLLSVCCFTPLYGRLCNIIGRRKSSIMAGGLFGFGTVCCGFAGSMNQYILFRAVAGMGGGGMAVVGSVIVSDVVPLKSRGLYQGFANLLFGAGAAIGAPLGGFLGDTIGWRAAFWIQAPLLIFGLFLLYVKVREPKSFTSSTSSTMSTRDKLKRIDYAGSGTLVMSLTTLVVALTFKSTGGYEWGDFQVWGCLVTSVVAAAIFLLVEIKLAAEPILDVSMVTQRTAGFVALSNFLLAVLSFSTIYNVPLYFTAARLRSASDAGAHLIPNSVAVAVGSLSAGWYMRKTGKYWNFQAIAGFGILVSNVRLATWNNDTPEWILYITLIPSGFGFAATLTTTLLALFASVPREQIPVATGLSYLFRTTGQILGVALSSSLSQTILAKELRKRIVGKGSEELIEKILDSTAFIRTLSPDLQEKAMASWALALRAVFYCQIALASLVFLSLLPIGEHPLPDTVSADPIKAARAVVDEENGTT